MGNNKESLIDIPDGCMKCFVDGARRWNCPYAGMSSDKSYVLKNVKTPFYCKASWNSERNVVATKRNYF